MRIDKFLKNSRLIKRRSVAKEACDSGKISVNGKTAKAGTDISEGDIVKIEFGTKTISVKVLEMKDSQRKEDADSMYEIIENK